MNNTDQVLKQPLPMSTLQSNPENNPVLSPEQKQELHEKIAASKYQKKIHRMKEGSAGSAQPGTNSEAALGGEDKSSEPKKESKPEPTPKAIPRPKNPKRKTGKQPEEGTNEAHNATEPPNQGPKKRKAGEESEQGNMVSKKEQSKRGRL